MRIRPRPPFPAWFHALVVALALPLAPVAGATPGFLSPFLVFDAGLDPAGVAVADFDEDGQLDLAVSNRSSNAVSVLRGLPGHDYAPPVAWPAGAGPAWIVAGDVNADGHADVVTADEAGSGLSLLLGDGAGSFAAVVPIATPTPVVVVAIGDLDGDGRVDLVSCGPAADSIYAHFGTGGGAFAPPGIVATGYEPLHLGLGDLDQDSRLDVVVGLRGINKLGVHRGGVGGMPGPLEYVNLPGRAWAVELADLNRDGLTDVIAACPLEGRFSVLLGDGPVEFLPRSDYFVGVAGTGRLWLAVADLDADGNPDVAVANSYCHSVMVFQGDGSGSLTKAGEYPSGSGPRPLVAAYLDADGYPDLAVPGAGGVAGVLFGTGGGGFGAGVAADVGRNAYALRVADLDGGGTNDLVASRFDGILVRLGNGDGSFAPGTFYPGGVGMDLALADVDRSGGLDVVTVNYDGVTARRNAGDGTFLPPQPSAAGPWCTVEAADLSGDGFPDLAAGNCVGPYVYPLLGNGAGGFAASNYVTLPGTLDNDRVAGIALGDFNEDGAADIAVTCGGKCFVLLNQGSSPYFTGATAVTGGVDGAIAADDLDADGHLDLVAGDLVLFGTGAGTFTTGPRTGVATDGGIAIADVDGDGHADVVGAEVADDCVAVAHGDGTGAFARDRKYGAGHGPKDVLVADANGDGRPDILALNTGLCGPTDVNTVAVLPHAGGLVGSPERRPSPIHLNVSATPNPAGDRLEMLIATTFAGAVSVRITDLAGRTLHRQSLAATATPARLTWNLRRDSGERVAPGVCFYEVRAGGARRTGRFVVTY